MFVCFFVVENNMVTVSGKLHFLWPCPFKVGSWWRKASCRKSPVRGNSQDTSSFSQTLFSVLSIRYSVSNNCCLELIGPSARAVEAQQFFRALTLCRVLLGLSHVLFSSPHSPPWTYLSTGVQKINTSLADGSMSSGRKLLFRMYMIFFLMIYVFLWQHFFFCRK